MLTGTDIVDSRRKQRCWSSSSSSYDACTASESDAVGVTWVIPTRAICTAICSISSGSPPLARSSRRTSSSLSTRSTGWPPASSTQPA